jgi:hypothetical protein
MLSKIAAGGLSTAMVYSWKEKYCRMDVSGAKQTRAPEDGKNELKKQAEGMPGNAVLKHAPSREWRRPPRTEP